MLREGCQLNTYRCLYCNGAGSSGVEPSKFVIVSLDLPCRRLWEHRVDSLVRGEHLVEVAYIENILLELWFEFWNNFLIEQFVHIDILEPRVLNYFVDSSLQSDTLLWILL